MVDSVLFSADDLGSLVATLLSDCAERWDDPAFSSELSGSLCASPASEVGSGELLVCLKNGQKFKIQIEEVSRVKNND